LNGTVALYSIYKRIYDIQLGKNERGGEKREMMAVWQSHFQDETRTEQSRQQLGVRQRMDVGLSKSARFSNRQPLHWDVVLVPGIWEMGGKRCVELWNESGVCFFTCE